MWHWASRKEDEIPFDTPLQPMAWAFTGPAMRPVACNRKKTNGRDQKAQTSAKRWSASYCCQPPATCHLSCNGHPAINPTRPMAGGLL